MTSVNAQHIPAHSAVESSGQGTDSSQPHNASAAEEVNQKRHLRERHFTNYNEDYIQFDSIEFDERPYKRVRPDQVAAVPSIAASHLELETAWAVVVNAGESILDEEEDLLPAGAHEQVYVQVRNIVVAKWREDVSRYLTEKEAVAAVGYAHRPYAIAAWRFLTKTGYINFGVAPSMSTKQSSSDVPLKGTVIVVGAGMAGLAAARQLDAFGYRVIIVEGHGRPGGRVYTKQLKSGDMSAVADLGGSILTGIDGNPLAVLAKQLHIPLHVIDEADVPLYHDDGKQANTALDQEVEKKWNDLLDECSKYRDAMGEVADNISLGTALETLWDTMEGAPQPRVLLKKRGRKKLGLETASSDATDAPLVLIDKAVQEAVDKPSQPAAHGMVMSDIVDADDTQVTKQPAAEQTADEAESTVMTYADGIKQEEDAAQLASGSDEPSSDGPAVDSVKQEATPAQTNGQIGNEAPVSALDSAVYAANDEHSCAQLAETLHESQVLAEAKAVSAAVPSNHDESVPNAESNDIMPIGNYASASVEQRPSGVEQPGAGLTHGSSTDGHTTDTVKAVPGLANRHEGASPLGHMGEEAGMTDVSPAAAASLQKAASTAVAAAASGLTDPEVEPALLLKRSGSGAADQTGSDSALAETSGSDALTAAKAAIHEALKEAVAPAVAESAEVRKLKRQLLDWHMANLEFANAAVLRTLSMRSWDQDDPYEIQGSHCFLPGCNLRLVKALATGLPILYNHVVKEVKYDQGGVKVSAGNSVIAGDAVIVTASLGVLKRERIRFAPLLPERKLGAIRRLGFGVLNKVVMLFERDFWGGADMFGRLAPSTQERGKFFLFYSYSGISGGPLLAALVSGEAAEAIEKVSAGEAVAEVMTVLRGIFEPQGIQVPTPLQACCTRWGQDPMVFGSYSSVGVGSQGTEDYDIMAESIGDRLFFAGEGTTRKFPATMHGAFASGLREAANVDATLSRLKHQHALQQEKMRLAAAAAKAAAEQPVKDEQLLDPSFSPNGLGSGQFAPPEAEDRAGGAAQMAHQMSQVFDNDDIPPDAEFGCFQAINGPPESDFSNEVLVRLDVGDIKKRGAPRRSMPIFFTLSQANAQRLQDVAGGDEARVNFLTSALGLQLVGRAGLTPAQQDLLKAVLARRQEQQAALPLPPPPPPAQQTKLPNGTQAHQHYQSGHVGYQQRPYASQQPDRHHQIHHQASKLPSWAQQPQQPQQRSWGSQEPVRYPGHKAAGGRGRPVYSAPYTQPYYAAQYNGQQRPASQQHQQSSWQAGASGQHSRPPAQYPGFDHGSQGAAQHTRPPFHALNYQQAGHVHAEPVDLRRQSAAYKDRVGHANGSHSQGQNGWEPKQEYGQPSHQQGQNAGQHA